MNKENQKQIATAFAANPDVKTFHVTRDGQCFHSWHGANEHSKSLGTSDEDRKVEEVKREDYVTEGKKTLLEQIEDAQTIEEVEALIKINSPKAAKDAAQAKIEKLTANA